MSTKLTLPVIFILLVLSISPACKKKKSDSPASTGPYVDTTALLTAHKWLLNYVWADNNDNGIKDTSASEIIPGTSRYTVYKFNSGGTISDSTPTGVIPGTWYFKGVTKDSVYINLNNISFSLLSILSINDSTMSAKLWGTAEYWYFVKF